MTTQFQNAPTVASLPMRRDPHASRHTGGVYLEWASCPLGAVLAAAAPVLLISLFILEVSALILCATTLIFGSLSHGS